MHTPVAIIGGAIVVVGLGILWTGNERFARLGVGLVMFGAAANLLVLIL